MSITIHRGPLLGGAAAIALLAGAIGFGVAHWTHRAPARSEAASAGRKTLYWYDPMVPDQHFDHPGKSPFMDMQLQPKYADQGGGTAQAPGVSIDAGQLQRLGARIVEARRGQLPTGLTATGTIDFNQRDVAIVQARSGGFVQRVYARAPGDVVRAGSPIADILVPEWNGAQAEFLAVRHAGDPALTKAARKRLLLLGMPAAMVADVERSGRVRNVETITTPTGGAIKTLGVRAGMTVAAGQTLAEIDGLGTVWLNAAVPEAVAGRISIGTTVRATLAAFPGQTFTGKVTAVLPEADATSRTLTVRVELPNRDGKLRPGMFATVSVDQGKRDALLVPSEAVIRTGRRTLVMLAGDGGRFRPAEVRVGAEADGQTEILEGLGEGEKIVASGQFLIDSEASLSGIEARPLNAATNMAGTRPTAPAKASYQTYETVGTIETIDARSVTLSHEAVPAIGWPAMTMTFAVPDASLLRGFRKGDRVRFAFDQPPEGPTLHRMTQAAGQ